MPTFLLIQEDFTTKLKNDHSDWQYVEYSALLQ